MPEATHKSLQILNSVLDKMLSSDEFRQQAAQSGLEVLDIAALLINASHPKLSLVSKHIIHQQMLEAVMPVEILPTSESNDKDSTSQVAELLSKNTHPELSKSAKSRIFDKMMASVPEADSTETESDLTAPAKERIFGKVLEAQQQLQIDALLTSDEALAIAKENPDPVIQAAIRLKTAPLPVLSADGRARIRERVLQTKAQSERRILRPTFGATFQRMVATIVIFLFISLIIIPQSAADSLPGDALYPVKRGIENVALQLANSDIRRIDLHLNQADERIEELDALLRLAIYNMELLDDAFSSLEAAGNIARGNALYEDIVFQNEVSATYLALDRIMQDYIVNFDVASLQSFIARQNELITVLMLFPENNAEEINLIEADDTLVQESDIPTLTPDIAPTSQTSLIRNAPLTVYARINTGGNVRVRNLPDINATILALIMPGDAVTQLAISQDTFWTEVQLEDGTIGWIASFLLADTPGVITSSETSDTASNNANNGAISGNSSASSTGNSTNTVDNSDNDTNNGNAYGIGNGNAYGIGNGNANGNGNGNRNP